MLDQVSRCRLAHPPMHSFIHPDFRRVKGNKIHYDYNKYYYYYCYQLQGYKRIGASFIQLAFYFQKPFLTTAKHHGPRFISFTVEDLHPTRPRPERATQYDCI